MEPRPVFEAIQYCHGVVTSTDALKDYIKKLVDKPVITIPDRVNFNEVKYIKTKHIDKARRVAWFGFANNIKYIERTFDCLKKNNLELTIYSNQSVYVPEKYNVRFIKYRHEIINEEIIKHDFVILPDATTKTVDLDGRLKFKSQNKTVQCWAWGMPVAKTPQDINRFMDAKERERESKKRLKEAKDKWDIKQSVEEYKEFINLLQTKHGGVIKGSAP